MTKLKRLATKEDEIVDVKIPISNEELKDRAKQYDLLTPKRFATRYNKMLFLPTSFKWNGSEYPIQYNYCINPFCCNFGKEQQNGLMQRSEEHTSELQSRGHLVCRLLL